METVGRRAATHFKPIRRRVCVPAHLFRASALLIALDALEGPGDAAMHGRPTPSSPRAKPLGVAVVLKSCRSSVDGFDSVRGSRTVAAFGAECLPWPTPHRKRAPTWSRELEHARFWSERDRRGRSTRCGLRRSNTSGCCSKWESRAKPALVIFLVEHFLRALS
jgi:hypothetical protein